MIRSNCNNKGSDQTVCMSRLVCAVVVRNPTPRQIFSVRGQYNDDNTNRKLESHEFGESKHGLYYYHMGLNARKPDYVACEQPRRRPASSFAESDQCLFYLLSEKYILLCFMLNFNILAGLCSR